MRKGNEQKTSAICGFFFFQGQFKNRYLYAVKMHFGKTVLFYLIYWQGSIQSNHKPKPEVLVHNVNGRIERHCSPILSAGYHCHCCS